MQALSLVSDAELLALVPRLVADERGCLADLVEHLIELDRRRLYADAACSSLSGYCIERLGFAEDEAFKRVRVARLASRFPRVLDELRTGAIHLTGLFLLSQYLTDENHAALLDEARGKTKREIEALIARHFPKPDFPDRVALVPEQVPMLVPGAPTCSGASTQATRGREQPLSATRWLVQFSAGGELHAKIERARELSSHAVPGGELELIFGRALDLLIAEETKKKQGAGKSRKARAQKPGSSHVPVDTRRAIEERDEGRCSFVDPESRRCTARRFITVEHEHPRAFHGSNAPENLSLLCSTHNQLTARRVFGTEHIERKRAEREWRATLDKVKAALRSSGFKDKEANRARDYLEREHPGENTSELLRAAFQFLHP